MKKIRKEIAKSTKVTALPGSEDETNKNGGFNGSIAEEGSNFRVGTGEMAIHPGSVAAPDFKELEDSAQYVYSNLKQLRDNLCDLRKCHTDGVRSFKADI